jgi:hypothetical protein
VKAHYAERPDPTVVAEIKAHIKQTGAPYQTRLSPDGGNKERRALVRFGANEGYDQLRSAIHLGDPATRLLDT